MAGLFGGGGGSSASTKFNAGSIPQSLYGLGGDINYFRQHDLEPLESSPVSLINWALGQAGVPVQQTTGAGGYIQGPTGSAGGNAGVVSGTQIPQGASIASGIPSNPWAGKTAGNYGDPTSWYNWVAQNAGKYIYINGQPTQIQNTQDFLHTLSQAQANGAVSSQPAAEDPYLQQAQQLWGQLTGTGSNLISGGQAELQKGETDLNNVPGYSTILGAGTPFFNQATSMFNTAAPLVAGNLTPQQAALINQATQSQKAGITQQLASEGLQSSTMLQEKLGAAEQAGAATAGGLIQGNIGLGEGEQQQAIAEQGAGINAINASTNAAQLQFNVGQTEANLGLNMQTTGANYLSAVATANLQTQQQFYNEAMAGYGVLGNLLNQQLQTFGLQGQLEGTKIGASTSANQIQAQQQLAQQQADAQGFSGFLSGIGSLLGGGKGGIGGGIGGLIGGASSLFGGGAAAGGAAGAAGGVAAAGGSLAGIGSAVGSALTALSAAFCQAGREIFGEFNPEWMLLRDLMLYQAPRWLRKWYIRNAATIAIFFSKNILAKRIVRTILRVIMGM